MTIVVSDTSPIRALAHLGLLRLLSAHYDRSIHPGPDWWLTMPWTTTDLFRRGTPASPRMTHVRIGKDVEVFSQDGVNWVETGTGGVSTFSAPGPGNPWWVLPAGSEYPDELLIVNDHGHHFSWEPRMDMPLADFVDALAIVESNFRKVN